ncbi:MAG: ATP-binding protein [Gemmataceae bacterium]|nr:ATP-binding protein [Gemmataceae bacterium]
MLAHELRNPLAPIRNAVEVLRLLGPTDSLLYKAREMIERQVTHMARLVDDLLDMSRLSRGKILLRKEKLDLVPLVRQTLDDYCTLLEANGQRLHLDLAEGPLYVQGDPTRLAQILGNVLHNASKFTDPGGDISVELGHDGEDPVGARSGDPAPTALLSVRDTGIGMEPEMLARVFETFSQADRSLDRSRGGLGLGLALVKGLVGLHGGDVQVHSSGPGQGTQVAIRLPLEAHEAPLRQEAAAAPGAGGPYRVLVIEDSPDTAESLRLLFLLTGHEVEVAHTGPAGVTAARSFCPEVVVCDVGLPGGMDGYAVARALRREPASASAFLIALTGYGREDDQRRCAEAGFDLHLTKPADPNQLQRLLAGQLRSPD